MIDDFDIEIQADEYLEYLDYLGHGIEWPEKFEENFDYEE